MMMAPFYKKAPHRTHYLPSHCDGNDVGEFLSKKKSQGDKEIMREFQYSLEKYTGPKSRHKCPECGAKGQFSRYVDGAGKSIADHVGKCNRLDKCGYHLPPKEYFAKNKSMENKNFQTSQDYNEELPTSYVPDQMLERTLSGWKETNLAKFLIRTFGHPLAQCICNSYFLGQSKRDSHKASIYWQLDSEGKIRTGKIMCYDEKTGKRRKEEGLLPSWVHNGLPQPYNLKQCFFGEQLLPQFPNKPIAIVEAEKTALMAAIVNPEILWLATGGVNGVKWTEYNVHKVLKNRRITLFPDFGFYNKKKEITCYDKWREVSEHIKQRMPCDIKVSRILEDNLNEEDRIHGYDLADFLIQADPSSGLAVDNTGKPLRDLYSPDEWVNKFIGVNSDQGE